MKIGIIVMAILLVAAVGSTINDNCFRPPTDYSRSDWAKICAYRDLCQTGEVEGNATKLVHEIEAKELSNKDYVLLRLDLTREQIDGFLIQEQVAIGKKCLESLRNDGYVPTLEMIEKFEEATTRIRELGEDPFELLNVKDSEIDGFYHEIYLHMNREYLEECRIGDYSHLRTLVNMLRDLVLTHEELGTSEKEIKCFQRLDALGKAQAILEEWRKASSPNNRREEIEYWLKSQDLTFADLKVSAREIRKLEKRSALYEIPEILQSLRAGPEYEGFYLESANWIRAYVKRGIVSWKEAKTSEAELRRLERQR